MLKHDFGFLNASYISSPCHIHLSIIYHTIHIQVSQLLFQGNMSVPWNSQANKERPRIMVVLSLKTIEHITVGMMLQWLTAEGSK